VLLDCALYRSELAALTIGHAQLWNGVTGGYVTSPAVSNGMVYVGSGDGKLYTFGLPPASVTVHPDLT
jgi:hypothetical protein